MSPRTGQKMVVRKMINDVEYVLENGYWEVAEYLRRMYRLGDATYFTDAEWTALTREIAA